ncbi:hypothetical protein M426DRAFT_24182 [Hypoxylon sp. CI-4A]|nr:hypothetical protein M426DRAFT_24182 [Hypoxylon sp. CI-4A]
MASPRSGDSLLNMEAQDLLKLATRPEFTEREKEEIFNYAGNPESIKDMLKANVPPTTPNASIQQPLTIPQPSAIMAQPTPEWQKGCMPPGQIYQPRAATPTLPTLRKLLGILGPNDWRNEAVVMNSLTSQDISDLKPFKSYNILVTVDIETLCYEKLDARTNTFYKPITEVGISWLYATDLHAALELSRTGSSSESVSRGRKAKPVTSPGDRGLNLRQFIYSQHYIVKEYSTHTPKSCTSGWHDTEPYNFAFGKSKMIAERDLRQTLERTLQVARKPGHRKSKNDVYGVNLFAWDSIGEEAHFQRLGLNWFREYPAYDLQQLSFLRPRFSQAKAAFWEALNAIGLRWKDNKADGILHNAGNNAAFAMQLILAISFLTPDQFTAFFNGDLPQMPYSWVGFTIDQVNKGPEDLAESSQSGTLKSQRLPHERNVHSTGDKPPAPESSSQK